ncbi:phosphoribosylglycinamide formyltransferase [Endozoicomonas sp. SM1973]|uniref:Phosphoribosylglycinamide formyltransferase n=1 Tax=Spartinivicinus marinus TaxID=2994442 RepID=A0A853IDN5_9GAMM|nr:phosphoribosylglycinamide formyltransferase [Spartinivicinus marinus]MCX4028697.1 phosphoribosylglycinamide formyltransferase [Spartinivicinus marinus]NYZ68041.1 phosphoribosylglycinamide formyltransferase [Spartinivicinus marinus]
MKKPINVVVVISGSGSNLQALIDQAAAININITGVISNIASAYGLTRAAQANIPTQVVDHTQFSDRTTFDTALMAAIDSYQPDLVVLAGFMRILTPTFTKHYTGRMLNIHPSLLPKYRGLHTHKRALEAGDKEHGATVHFVTEELDGGPNVIQAIVPVAGSDTEASLMEKVQQKEHKIYPQAVAWFAEGNLKMEHNKAFLLGEMLPPTGKRLPNDNSK